MPDINIKDFQKIPQASIITDREGNELFRFYNENRRRANYRDISPHMINAIVSTEDKDFRTNEGVDKKAIIRAIINNIKSLINDKENIQ